MLVSELVVQLNVPMIIKGGVDDALLLSGCWITDGLILTAKHGIERWDKSRPIVAHLHMKKQPIRYIELSDDCIVWIGGDDLDAVLLKCPKPATLNIVPITFPSQPPKEKVKWNSLSYGKGGESLGRISVSGILEVSGPEDQMGIAYYEKGQASNLGLVDDINSGMPLFSANKILLGIVIASYSSGEGRIYITPAWRLWNDQEFRKFIYVPKPQAPKIIDTSLHPLVDGCAPSWASGWGQDEFGVFVDFQLNNITQRMRWVPAGQFMMGSSDDEPGRSDDEGPVHEVTLASGFWLFDTPVTQILWHEVMGENPSEFKSPERPVENVSWLDAQKFISNLSQRIAGLNLSLPSEAQWEYACRGGTNKPPADLKESAWYRENSMDDYELQGESGTHPVGQKRANAYGLYDMLGNVWEWCEDDWHGSYDGAPNDGSAWKAKGAAEYRVVRGGSWGYSAQSVRAAYRYRNTPEFRFDDLGIRCACVQK